MKTYINLTFDLRILFCIQFISFSITSLTAPSILWLRMMLPLQSLIQASSQDFYGFKMATLGIFAAWAKSSNFSATLTFSKGTACQSSFILARCSLYYSSVLSQFTTNTSNFGFAASLFASAMKSVNCYKNDMQGGPYSAVKRTATKLVFDLTSTSSIGIFS